MAIGAHWSGSGPQGARAHVVVRTSSDGAAWSDWTALPDQGDDAKAAPPSRSWSSGAGRVEGWTQLLLARGRYIQARLALDAPDAAAAFDADALVLHYFNSDAGPPAPANHASRAGVDGMSAPSIVLRSGWGADERRRFGAGGAEIWPPVYTEPRAQLVHHTVTANDPADPAAVVRAIYQYHAVTQGWGDIGYNFLIDHRGNIYEGRHGGEREGRIVQGGHALQFNANTIGVALLGTFTGAAARPSGAAEAALVELLADRGVRYAIDPFAPVTLAGTHFAQRVLGHRDALPGHTACPGEGVQGRLPSLRAAVAARMEVLTRGPTPTPPPSPVTPTDRPPSPSATPPTNPGTPLPPGCVELVAGGDFEVEREEWRREHAYYTRWDVYRGETALFVGLRNDDPDTVLTLSSAVQTIRLPDAPGSARLTFAARAQGDGADRRWLRVWDEGGGEIALDDVDLLATELWSPHTFDLTGPLAGYAGRDVQLAFGVVNNGDGRRSHLRIDDVALVACPLGEVPPSSTPMPPVPTGTPTVSPAATETEAPSATATEAPSAIPTPSPEPSPTPSPRPTPDCARGCVGRALLPWAGREDRGAEVVDR